MPDTTTEITPDTTTLNPDVTIPKGKKQTVKLISDIENAEDITLTIEIKCSKKVLELSKLGFTTKPGTTTVITGTQTIKASDTKLTLENLSIKNNNTKDASDAIITITIVNKESINSSDTVTQSYA